MTNIRNFCIIAHIDHGKSTLADRLIEMAGVLTQREMQNQVLDNMELERERGITIKAQSCRLIHRADDGREYVLNLIDTPGHVDFTYEVSRSLAACEGAVLVVDAAQGVEAQTLANVYLALDNDLEVVPVINKIDLIAANPENAKKEIEDLIGLDASEAPLISAKNKINIGEVFQKIIEMIPPPKGDPSAPLKALIFDSIYDAYKGVIVFIRVLDGQIKRGTNALFMATDKQYSRLAIRQCLVLTAQMPFLCVAHDLAVSCRQNKDYIACEHKITFDLLKYTYIRADHFLSRNFSHRYINCVP